MQEETSRASLSMMMPRDQTVSSWYTWPLPDIVYRRQDTVHVRHVAAHVKGIAGLGQRPAGNAKGAKHPRSHHDARPFPHAEAKTCPGPVRARPGSHQGR